VHAGGQAEENRIVATSEPRVIADLAAFVKARRSELGLTQEEVAYAAKLEQTVISRIERGVHRPGPIVAKRIALALKLSENGLFTS
jgi:transcriptional regulator with XRE-family HTH domain